MTSHARAENIRRHYAENGISGEHDAETLAADVIADQLRALPEDVWEHVLTCAIGHAHEEIHGHGTARGLILLVEGLAYPKGHTYTVTIAGPERHDGEAPFVWAVTAADRVEAALKAANIHATTQNVSPRDLKLVDVIEGVPGPDAGRWNDYRDK